MRVPRFTPEELSPWHRAFASAAANDAILHPVNAVGAVRWNTAFAYLDPARERENLTILADTLVDRVLLLGDRAVGLATAAGELRAQTVVLAAGAYGSPGILLRSGIGPERELPVGQGLSDPAHHHHRALGVVGDTVGRGAEQVVAEKVASVTDDDQVLRAMARQPRHRDQTTRKRPPFQTPPQLVGLGIEAISGNAAVRASLIAHQPS